jgi:hypothetical protein
MEVPVKPRRPPSLPLVCVVFPDHSSFSVLRETPVASAKNIQFQKAKVLRDLKGREILIVLLIRYVAGKMVARIATLSKAAEKVATGNYGSPLFAGRHDEIGQLVESFNGTIGGLKERDFIRNTFGRYVDAGIAKEIMKRPEEARLGGEERDVAVLMSPVNLTQKIQAMAKGGEVLRSHSAYAHVAEGVALKNSFEVQPKGVSETIKLYVIESSGRHPTEKCARLHVRFPFD